MKQESLDAISHISIYLKEKGKIEERVNEVAIFQPLNKKASFNENNKVLQQRKWTFSSPLSFSSRCVLKLKQFFFKYFEFTVPLERKSNEAKFKTVLAILLAQESLRDFFLGTEEKKSDFLDVVASYAKELGVYIPKLSLVLSSHEISRSLTLIEGKELSLIDDPYELNLQMSALSLNERNALLSPILNEIKRPPITSILEIAFGDLQNKSCEITTKYAKYKVKDIDPQSQQVHFTISEDKGISSITTESNWDSDAKGVMNQRITHVLLPNGEKKRIGSYCGELISSNNVLEQILFMLSQTGIRDAFLYKDSHPHFEEKTLLFISLYSWNELQKILDEQKAIEDLNGKYLKITDQQGNEKTFHLNMIYLNISFNAFNRFPIPSETQSVMNDINAAGMIPLIYIAFQKLKLDSPELNRLYQDLKHFEKEKDFATKHKGILNVIDRFQTKKRLILDALENVHFANQEASTLYICLKALLLRKIDHQTLSGIDEIIYLDILAQNLSIEVNTNCHTSLDRSAGADATHKAQCSFMLIQGHPFFPDAADDNEVQLFKILYSMYLVWEEPELTTALSTGFMGEKFFDNFLQRNPETTHYLMPWLKKHPEMYLGLSEHRA